MENTQNYLKTLDELNQEMKYHDPYKWLLRIEEPEEIAETVEQLENEIERLEGPHEFIGSKKEYKLFEQRLKNRIKYLNECIDILELDLDKEEEE